MRGYSQVYVKEIVILKHYSKRHNEDEIPLNKPPLVGWNGSDNKKLHQLKTM